MDQSFDDFEPLFDYSRVQPNDITFSDDEFDSSPIPIPVKKKKFCEEGKKEIEKEGRDKLVILDDEDDWLLPPPTVQNKFRSDSGEDNMIKELREKKQELASIISESADDILKSVTASAKSNIGVSGKCDVESRDESSNTDRKKILISVQDKDGQKQFRMYKDDKFEKLFKMYAKKIEVEVEKITFSFDGDRVAPNATPESLDLEDDDMLEANLKST